MRIALVSQEYPPETAHGGIATQTRVKAHGMAALGHEMYVVSHSTDHERHAYREGPVHVVRIPGFDERLSLYTQAARWITYSANVAAEVARLHAEVTLDLVDFPEYGGEAYVHLLNRTEWNPLPTVIQLHGPLVMLASTVGWPEPGSEFLRTGVAIEGTCLRLADAVYSSSRTSAEWCADRYGLGLERVPVLHTGIDTELFRPVDAPKADRPTVIFVGKLVENKGAELLLEAAIALSSVYPDLHLRMLGRGEERVITRLHNRAREAGCPNLLELPGFVSRDELPSNLAQAHVFAVPSRYEGGPGFVYLEAMACGLPVIACRGSGAAEVVVPGHNGLLVGPNDVDELTAALNRLLSNPAERTTLGAQARAYAVSQADSRQCLRRLETFYTAVVTGGLDEWIGNRG